MTELRFSVIGDDNESIAEIAQLAKEFQEASHTTVNISRLSWDRAWLTLFMTAIEGKGEDVSQVGSTWAPTLAAVDSLRPFSDAEVRTLGGPLVFVPGLADRATRRAGRCVVHSLVRIHVCRLLSPRPVPQSRGG